MSEKQNMKISKKHRKIEEDKINHSYVLIREALEGETSTYQLNYFDKFRRLFQYLEIQSGKAAKKRELELRRQSNKLAGLQIACNKFLEGVYERIKPRNNPDGNKVVTVQLDPRFTPILNNITKEDMSIEVNVKKINKNYLKYTEDIPIQMEVKRRDSNTI